MMSSENHLTDEQIASEIQRRELEIEYLKELSASLGFSDLEPWTEETFQAIDDAPLGQRRRAAIRTLRLAGDEEQDQDE